MSAELPNPRLEALVGSLATMHVGHEQYSALLKSARSVRRGLGMNQGAALPSPLQRRAEGRQTMRSDPKKVQRQRIPELAMLAYERELARELGAVEVEFSRWRCGEINAHELSERVHVFHDGAARRLHSVYNGDLLEMAVGSAIARGVLTEEEVPSEVVEVLRRHIDFARAMGSEEETSAETPPNR